MSDDEPHFASLKDRIAALNLQNGPPPTPSEPVKRPVPAPKPKPALAPKPAVAPKPSVTGTKPAIAPKPAKPSPSPVSAVSSTSTSSWSRPTPIPSSAKPAPSVPVPSWKQAPAPVPAPAPSWVKPSPSSSPQPTGPARSPALPSRPQLPQRRPSDAPTNPEPAPSPVDPSARPPPPLPGRGSARPPLPARKPSADVAQPDERTSPPEIPRKGSTPGRLKPELLNGFKRHNDEEHNEQALEPAPVPAAAARPRPPLPAGKPGLPPRLPSRDENDDSTAPAKPPPIPEARPETAPLPKRTLPPSVSRAPSPRPPPKPAEPAESSRDRPPPIPLNSRPPPVPLNSRPKTAPAPAPVPVPAAAPPFDGGPIDLPPVICLVCRDYTASDAVAAQYPRAQLPQDPVGYLAEVLCGPFEYMTDKARAIFTWCHHNIAYDAANFLAGTVPRGHTAEDTIRYGKGVCDGYSKVYHAIAERAGLECVVIQGHGKGYNYAPPPPGVVPPRDSNHAWNAVRLDDGAWKLVDACWGAGHIDNGVYNPVFDAPQFTMSNEAFAQRHHPNEEQYQFRDDPLSWEEYVAGPVGGLPQPTWFSSAKAEGLDETALEPAVRDVNPRDYAGGSVRFQVPWMCEHWGDVLERRGGALLLMLHVGGEYQPLEYNGEWWWIDVPAATIRADDKLMLVGLDQMGGVSARGMTRDEFLAKKGRVGYSFIGMAKWELV